MILLISICMMLVSALTVEEVRAEIEEQSIQHGDIVLRQAILETGWFSSYNCLVRNNLFGFWYKDSYIIYDSWEESVEYYKNWQDRHYKGGNYYDFLVEVGYATDPEYVTKLKNIKLEHNELQHESARKVAGNIRDKP